MIVNKTWFKIFEIILSAITAVVVAFFAKKYGSNNFLSDLFVGFMIPYVFLIPFQITGKSVEQTHDLDKALKKLKKTNKETYKLYKTEVNELTKSIQGSCETLLYKCSYKPNMELYKAVCSQLMSPFSGKTDQDYFFATAFCTRDSINWFFDKFNLAGEFLPLLNEKCKTNKITDFKRLFIYSDDDLKNPVLYFLATLHNNTKKNTSNSFNFDFKFINVTTFYNLTQGKHISDEMGIWGTHCVFIQKNDMSPKGYCFEKDAILAHKEIFEDLWSNRSSVPFDSLGVTIDTLEANSEFEKKILEILTNIKNGIDKNIICVNKSDDQLSLLDIVQIQNWVQGEYPISSSESL